MAISTSTAFTQTAQSIIEDARAELGILADEEPLEDVDLQRGLRILNRMLKSWEVKGLPVWTLTEVSFTLIQGQFAYPIGAGGTVTTVPVQIEDDVQITRSGSNKIDMFRLSREEYHSLPNPTNEGYPTQFYYDRQRDGGTMYVWPAPDSALGTITYSYQRKFFDMLVGSNDFDLPQEWLEAIMYGCAARMVGPYGKAGSADAARVEREAARSYSEVESFTLAEGEASVSVTPDFETRGYRRGGR